MQRLNHEKFERMDNLAHKTHSWKQWSVELAPGPQSRITGACVIWLCRCGATANKEYTFRKPSGKEGVKKKSDLEKEAEQLKRYKAAAWDEGRPQV